MVGNILSATTVGFDGQIIEVECDASKGLPTLQIVGLGNKAIDEAKERVRSAIKNSHLDFPTKRITINLAPANIPKDGAHFDLPIALAILTIGDQILPDQTQGKVFAGELSLNGNLRPIRGALHLAETARKRGANEIYLPVDNAEQASLINGIRVIGVDSLRSLFLHLTKEKIIPPITDISKKKNTPTVHATSIDDIQGQDIAKRALAIAAAGHHNVLFTGPPGTGKTMLAKSLVELLPHLGSEEQIEVMKLHSLSGDTQEIQAVRPFRSPHHTASHISLVGGGRIPRPGEMSLAHHGVLFLDELPEYPRASLEAMRQPLEDRQVSISRAEGKVTFPANFMLVATQNPCPCGYLGDTIRECSCTNAQITLYRNKVSGPLLDRIDLVVPVSRIDHKEILAKTTPKKSYAKLYKQNIKLARDNQFRRYHSRTIHNSSLSTKEIRQYIAITPEVSELLDTASKRLDLSTRSYFKVLKVARTIADLENADTITVNHLSEALQYRISH